MLAGSLHQYALSFWLCIKKDEFDFIFLIFLKIISVKFIESLTIIWFALFTEKAVHIFQLLMN